MYTFGEIPKRIHLFNLINYIMVTLKTNSALLTGDRMWTKPLQNSTEKEK